MDNCKNWNQQQNNTGVTLTLQINMIRNMEEDFVVHMAA